MDERIVSESELRAILGVGHTTVWQWQRDGLLPRRRQIGPNRVGWLHSEILDWLKDRPVIGAGSGL
jgi:prophage regulatory protein